MNSKSDKERLPSHHRLAINLGPRFCVSSERQGQQVEIVQHGLSNSRVELALLQSQVQRSANLAIRDPLNLNATIRNKEFKCI